MANYAKQLPVDVAGASMHEYPPAYKALITTQTANQVASSVININPNTTILEISSYGGQGAVIRWVPKTETAAASSVWWGSVIASGAGANFDNYVAPSTTRRFVVPRETMGQMAGGQVGSVNGLYQRIAWVNAGIGGASILATEF